jgi:hypothetical protein
LRDGSQEEFWKIKDSGWGGDLVDEYSSLSGVMVKKSIWSDTDTSSIYTCKAVVILGF